MSQDWCGPRARPRARCAPARGRQEGSLPNGTAPCRAVPRSSSALRPTRPPCARTRARTHAHGRGKPVHAPCSVPPSPSIFAPLVFALDSMCPGETALYRLPRKPPWRSSCDYSQIRAGCFVYTRVSECVGVRARSCARAAPLSPSSHSGISPNPIIVS